LNLRVVSIDPFFGPPPPLVSSFSRPPSTFLDFARGCSSVRNTFERLSLNPLDRELESLLPRPLAPLFCSLYLHMVFTVHRLSFLLSPPTIFTDSFSARFFVSYSLPPFISAWKTCWISFLSCFRRFQVLFRSRLYPPLTWSFLPRLFPASTFPVRKLILDVTALGPNEPGVFLLSS